MARLLLKFETSVLREVSVGSRPITIGRAPDNDIRIDNLAVSDHHARIYSEGGRLRVEDLNSLNGISLNRYPITREALNSGDEIGIGKHLILVDLDHDAWGSYGAEPKVAAPKIEETVLVGRHRKSNSGSPSADSAADGQQANRARVPSLIVLKGKTNRMEYLLSAKLALIGKSSMATVQLSGWFSPGAAAQISQRRDGYYISPLSRRKLTLNGNLVTDLTRLNEGDVIEVAGISLKFVFRD
jgi:pSer/pThr/pTyr-binding forkhead associated (FHA) protein